MQVKSNQLRHRKYLVGTLPFIDQVLEQIGFRELLHPFICHEQYGRAIEVMLKSMLIEPAALYRIPEWAQQFELKRMGNETWGDDRLGRALDRLFKADRASLQTQLMLKIIAVYEVDTSTIHNDSTTVKFYGAYNGQSKSAVQLKRGHSKDHRPDLKQLVYNLSVTEDGNVPVHFKCHDGNRTDDTLHIETWLTLRGLLRRSDFLYVADSKLCTSDTMTTIDRESGRFVSIVPNTRKEAKTFAQACYESDVRWTLLTRRQSSRQKDRYDVFHVAEGLYQLEEGFRLYWYRSSEKRKRDETSRTERMEKALEKLAALEAIRRRGPKTKKGLMSRAQSILKKYHVEGFIHVDIKTKTLETFKKTTRGKAGPDATYRRITKTIPYLVITKNLEGVARALAIDGIFPLTTNTKLGAKQTLAAYKYQPYLEKHFSWIKSDYELAPVFLKNNQRIEALMFICYLAALVAAIIQRQLRLTMKNQKIQTLRLLPEERPTATPTWEQVKRLFTRHAKYELYQNSHLLRTFWDELSPHQRQVIQLLDLPVANFSNSTPP